MGDERYINIDDEQCINIEDGLSVEMSIGKIELSVGKIANKYEIFTEEEIYNINGKVPELDERVGNIEDDIEEINSSLEDITSELEVKADKSYVDSAIESVDVSSQLTNYATKSELEVKADKSYVDSAIESVDVSSQLTNYATKSELSLKVDKVTGKSLISDSEIERLSTLKNYDDTEIKNSLNSKADKTDLHSHDNKSVLDGITSIKITEWNNKSTFDGNYNNLTNKPTIPTKTSELTNDSGFITSIPGEYVTDSELNSKGYLTEHQDISHLASKSEVVQTINNKKGHVTLPVLAYGTCSTAAATAEKAVVVDDPNWELEVGNIVGIRHSYTNSASNVTINVNNTGAYPIWYGNSEYTGNSSTYVGYANRTNTYMFTGTHWQWISNGVYPSTATNASLGQGYGTCTTAESTLAKACTISSYSLTVGGIVSIKFTNAVPANSTLNIRTRGAKKIFYRGVAITDGIIKAGDTATFIYDGTQYHLISLDNAVGNIPTKTSQLTNDSGFITTIPSEYITETELNSKGYLTEHQDISGKVDKINGYSLVSDAEISRLATLENYDDTEVRESINEANMELDNKANKSDLHSHSNKSVLDEITTSKITEWNNKSTFDGNYNTLTNKPTIPTKTSELTNDSGFITSIPNEYITESELNNKGYLTTVPSEYITETELNAAFDQFNPSSLQQVPLYANSIEECTDTTKCYVLPDGFIYAYKETTVEIEPPDTEDPDYDPNKPLYTNVFEVDGYNLNKRWSHSSKNYSNANGHVASGYIPVKAGDVVRIKMDNFRQSILNYDYNRVQFFDNSNNYVSGHYDGGIDDVLKLTDEGDNVFSFVVGYVCRTSANDSTNYLIEGANNITKMLVAFNIGHIVYDNDTMVLTDEDYRNANIIVTVNEEIKEPVAPQTSKNLVDTASYTLNARYNSSNTLKQTNAETGYVAFDYIEVKKDDVIRFKSTTRGYHNLGGTLLLWGNYPRLRFFNASNQQVASGTTDQPKPTTFFKTVDEGDNTTAIYVGYKADGTPFYDADQIVKTRFTIQPVGDNLPAVTEEDMKTVKITINTPMSELDNVLPPEGNTQVVLQWANTGHAFVPNENYDNLIADMKNITDEHSKDIAYLKAVVESGDNTSGLTEGQKIARIKNWDMPIYENAPIFLLNQPKPAATQADLTNIKVYEKYDTLMDSYSHYITREDCGSASDGITPIYIYHFREPEPHINGGKGSEKKPVILIVSGVHPTERAGEYSMYYAMEEITTNPELADLKRNVHFIVMPIINPTAVNDSTWGVRNPDGIQVHYNFEVDFKTPTTSGYVPLGERNHGGESPLSIPETQYFDKIMRDYEENLVLVMSCHNNDVDTLRGTDFIWCSCATNFATNLGYRLADKMSLAWRQKHGAAFDEGVIWANQYALQKASEGSSLFNPKYVKERPAWDWRVGQAGISGSGGTEYKQGLKYGVHGINVEVCSRNMVMDKDWSKTWSSNVMTWGCETYVNFLRMFMYVFDYKDKEQYYKK